MLTNAKYAGEVNDFFINNFSSITAPSFANLTSLIIADDSMNAANITSLQLSKGKSLQRIYIGSNCFKNVSTIKIANLNNLEKLVIDEYSFLGEASYSKFECFNCNHLSEIIIGKGSFRYYEQFSIFSISLG